MFLTFITISNEVSALIVPKFDGELNLPEGMLLDEGMMPIGALLQEPVVTCWPLVRGRLGKRAQKLIKLFDEVSEAT